MERPIAKSMEALMREVHSLSESGQTALGPAALLAVSVASQKAGSKVFICTDGLANVGVGALEGKKDDFYTQVAQFAKRKGVVISVISIKGSNTRLENLGELTDATGGDVNLLEPSQLQGNLAEVLGRNFIATQCVVSLYISPSFRFKYNDQNEDGTPNAMANRVTRDIGNLAGDSDATFEFEAVDEHPTATSVLFQAKIAYTQLSKRQMLTTFCSEFPTTDDRALAERNVDVRVVSASMAQACARFARNGDYDFARAKAKNTQAMLAQAINTQEQRELFQIFNNTFDEVKQSLDMQRQVEELAGVNVAALGRSEREILRQEQRIDALAAQTYQLKAAKSSQCIVQ